MRVAELPPLALFAAAGAIGVAGGLLASKLADALPPRYEIVHLTKGSKRTRRNAVVTALSVLAALALARIVSGYPDSAMGLATFYLVTNLLLVVGLIAASAVDLEHMILPNEITIGGAALALVTSNWRNVGLTGSLVGAAVGFLVAYLPNVLYKRLRGRSGQGFGDTKLVVMAGAWLGLEGALFVLFAAAVQSVTATVVMRLFGVTYHVPESVQADIADLRALAEAGDADAKELLDDDPMAAEAEAGLLAARLPLGPFLALSCVEFLFARRPILDAFQRYLGGG
jgi:leader peptidase (prepilin peptidase)/N-methyltransferase